jgi:hypothetical protein
LLGEAGQRLRHLAVTQTKQRRCAEYAVQAAESSAGRRPIAHETLPGQKI